MMREDREERERKKRQIERQTEREREKVEGIEESFNRNTLFVVVVILPDC